MELHFLFWFTVYTSLVLRATCLLFVIVIVCYDYFETFPKLVESKEETELLKENPDSC